MTLNCQERQGKLLERFQTQLDDAGRYRLIIELGRALPPVSPELLVPENLVRGCQSRTYLISQLEGDVLHFKSCSDALISAGLAALLVEVYSGETPQTILTCPPKFAQELKLTQYLTPSRSNGLYAVHLRMKQDAVQCLSRKTV